MSVKTITKVVCDHCGKECPGTAHFFIQGGGESVVLRFQRLKKGIVLKQQDFCDVNCFFDFVKDQIGRLT